MPDEVAIVSRNNDGSDAQPNGTERILDAEAVREADENQLAPTNAEPDSSAAVDEKVVAEARKNARHDRDEK